MIGNPIGYPIGGVENIALGNTGVVDVTLDDATLSASSALAISGQETTTLDDATLVATGTLDLAATAAITLDAATLVATGTLTLSGTAGITLDDVTLIATANVAARVLASIRAGGHINSLCNDGRGLVRMKVSGGKR